MQQVKREPQQHWQRAIDAGRVALAELGHPVYAKALHRPPQQWLIGSEGHEEEQEGQGGRLWEDDSMWQT